jgi:hypothetical protein
VFLLQPCELGFEFALIFVGHGVRQLKNAMRLRNAVEACGSLWKEYRPCQPGLQASVAVTWKFSSFFAGRSVT